MIDWIKISEGENFGSGILGGEKLVGENIGTSQMKTCSKKSRERREMWRTNFREEHSFYGFSGNGDSWHYYFVIYKILTFMNHNL